MVDVRVELYDGKSHSVDSSEMAFRTAASIGVKAALADAGTIVLEPVSIVTITVPADLQGPVLTDLSSRRARVNATDPPTMAARGSSPARPRPNSGATCSN